MAKFLVIDILHNADFSQVRFEIWCEPDFGNDLKQLAKDVLESGEIQFFRETPIHPDGQVVSLKFKDLDDGEALIRRVLEKYQVRSAIEKAA